jgi:hypothetical protein
MKQTRKVSEVVVEESPAFSPVPPGEYEVRFLHAEEAEGAAEYGPALRWVFEVLSGAHSKRRVSTLTGQKFQRSTAAGKVLSQLLGRPLDSGRVDLSELEGRRYSARVVPAGNGTRVESLELLDSNKPPEDTVSEDFVPF